MTELVQNTTDATVEKHVPLFEIYGNSIRIDIGSAPHPMTEEHHISWVYTDRKRQPAQKLRSKLITCS